MALTKMAFSPAIGLRDTTAYPTLPANETAAREQIQGRMDEIQDFLNDTMTVEVDAHLADNLSQALNVLYPPVPVVQAKIDGSDTGAILQAIVDYAAANGYNTLFCPAGTYIHEVKVSYPSNMTVIGVPEATIFKAKNGSESNPIVIEVNGKTNVKFKNITIEGNIDNITNFNNYCTIYQSSKVKFEFCKFQNTRGVAVILSTDISNSGLRFCDFNNCGTLYLTTSVLTDRKQAIAFTSGTLENNRGNFVDFCTFDTVGLDCISAGSQYNFRALGNIIKKNYAGSIYVSGSRNVKISLNEVENEVGGNGIDINACKGVSGVGNICRKCGAAGMLIADSSDVTLLGNVCKNNHQGTSEHQGGITIHSATAGVVMLNINISGNICTDDQDVKTQDYGIHWLAGSGTLQNIHIDRSNQLNGNKSVDISGNLSYDGAVNIALGAGESVTVCKSDMYGILDVIRYNDSVVGRLYLRSNQSPYILNDYTGSKFFNTDTGTEIAVYYDSGTSSIILKNKTAVSRNFKYILSMM